VPAADGEDDGPIVECVVHVPKPGADPPYEVMLVDETWVEWVETPEGRRRAGFARSPEGRVACFRVESEDEAGCRIVFQAELWLRALRGRDPHWER